MGSSAQIITPGDRGVRFDVDETADSYLENALLKCHGLLSILAGAPRAGTTSIPQAAEAAQLLASADEDLWVLADDSGIEVTALHGRPGVRSARYGDKLPTPPRNDVERYRLLLAELDSVEEREAAFVCAMVAAQPGGRIVAAQERWRGTIATGPQIGTTGFGYDPVFIPEGSDRSASMLQQEVKNRTSHRAQALRTVLTAVGLQVVP